jgi:mgtE-like transporter
MASSLTATAAGVLLAGITGTLERLPGLLVLVPAAIGMRGNIFGALGSRLATTIHAGTFRVSRRVDNVVGQNVVASAVLSLVTAVILGVVTKILAPAFGIESIIGLSDLIVVSTVGAVASSAVVLVVTLGLAASSARYGWDLDNVNAPLVSAVGDVVTLPALFAASALVSLSVFTSLLAVVLTLGAAASMFWGVRTRLSQLQQIVRESMPILLGTGAVLVFAGVVIEHRLEDFAIFPAVLILVPACLAGAGAIGGILAGRLASKLHLGVIAPAVMPSRSARRDLWFGFALAVPVFVVNGVFAHFAATLFAFDSPGFLRLLAISMTGGMIATLLAGAIAYYGTVLAIQLGVDPDTYGIPLVTSTVDLAGAAAIVAAISWIGLT